MDTSTPLSAAPEDKTVAILSYLTLIGFIVAIVLNNTKKNALGVFHLRQVLGFFLTLIGVVVCQFILVFIPFLGWLAIFLLWCAMAVCWVIGFLGAIRGQRTAMPIVGPLYQQWFANTFE
jgi:uncharacterized membrane protein